MSLVWCCKNENNFQKTQKTLFSLRLCVSALKPDSSPSTCSTRSTRLKPDSLPISLLISHYYDSSHFHKQPARQRAAAAPICSLRAIPAQTSLRRRRDRPHFPATAQHPTPRQKPPRPKAEKLSRLCSATYNYKLITQNHLSIGIRQNRHRRHENRQNLKSNQN